MKLTIRECLSYSLSVLQSFFCIKGIGILPELPSVRIRDVSVLWDVRLKEVSLYILNSSHFIQFIFVNYVLKKALIDITDTLNILPCKIGCLFTTHPPPPTHHQHPLTTSTHSPPPSQLRYEAALKCIYILSQLVPFSSGKYKYSPLSLSLPLPLPLCNWNY